MRSEGISSHFNLREVFQLVVIFLFTVTTQDYSKYTQCIKLEFCFFVMTVSGLLIPPPPYLHLATSEM